MHSTIKGQILGSIKLTRHDFEFKAISALNTFLTKKGARAIESTHGFEDGVDIKDGRLFFDLPFFMNAAASRVHDIDTLVLADALAGIAQSPSAIELSTLDAVAGSETTACYWIGKNSDQKRAARIQYGIERLKQFVGSDLDASSYATIEDMALRGTSLQADLDKLLLATTALRDIDHGYPSSELTATHGQGMHNLMRELSEHLKQRGALQGTAEESLSEYLTIDANAAPSP